jgi:hypothetical protein
MEKGIGKREKKNREIVKAWLFYNDNPADP